MGDAMKKWRFLVSGLCLVALVACNNQKPENKTAVDVGNKQANASIFPIQGKAKEVLDGGGYTYVLIATTKGETWVAIPGTKVTVGEACTVTEGSVMQNFPSKSMDRTFNEIIFAPGLAGKNADLATAAPGGEAATKSATAEDFDKAIKTEGGAAPGSGKAVVPFADLKIAKASGGNAYTVADIFAKGASLNGKKVKIKGQVVKFSPQIMGKNWLHLQDGSGDPKKNTHDLVVTSMNKAEKGNTVTVEGVLAANKDFGGGYKYAVIVEDVTITR